MRLNRSFSIVLIGLSVSGVALVCGAVLAADQPPAAGDSEPLSYHRDIRPIFQARCQGCHQPAKREGGFLMTSFAEMQQGGDSEEPGFVPGKPDQSLVISYITPQGDDPPEMPKDADPLSKQEIDLIVRWVSEGAQDDTPKTAHVAVDMDHPPVYTLPPVLTSLDFSPDGSLLAVSGYHEVLLHKGDGSGLVARLVGLSERIESARFSPDGKQLAVTGGSPGRFGELQVWEVESRQLQLSVPATYDTIYGVSWSGDGKRLAFGCSDNSVRAIEASSGKQILYQGAHTDWVLDTVFSSDGTHLVSVSRDRTMKLTEVATERFVDDITSITPGALKGGLMAVDRHPSQDVLLCGGADGEPKIYKMYRTQDRKIGDDFNLIRKFDRLPGQIFDVGFSADGSRIVAGSSDDRRGEVRVYETDSGKLLSKFADPGAVYAVACRADGKVVAAAGFEGTVKLIDASSGKTIREFVPVPITAAKVAASGGQ